MDRWIPEDETWFDDEATRRPVPSEPSLARLSPARQPIGQRPAVARLTVLVVAVVGLTVLIASFAAGNDPAAADRAYLRHLAAAARDSQAVGAAFSQLLTGHQTTQSTLESRLAQLVRRQEQDTASTAAIPPAPRLRDEHAVAVEAMQLRSSALGGLLMAFQTTQKATSGELSDLVHRLIASDVIWRDLFLTPTQRQLSRDGATGTSVQSSIFLARPSLAEQGSMAALLARLRAPISQPTSALGTLKSGDTGPTVSAWQRLLDVWLRRQPGQRALKVDGVYGQATVSATTRLQVASHITADGIAGPVTRKALVQTLHQQG
jgi:murein L,D-transpeptidase YcbB/YkuD